MQAYIDQMKLITKYILSCIVASNLLFSQCLLMNEIGLNPGHVSGSEAKEIIQDKMFFPIFLDILVLPVAPSLGPDFVAFAQQKTVLDFMAAELAGIQDDKFYKRSEVESCGETLRSFGIIGISHLNFAGCNLKPDNAIYDP